MVTAFFVITALLLVLGVPISITVGGASLFYILAEGIQPMIVAQRFFTGVNNTALLAIPFFILAGDLMNSGGIARRLVKLANVFIGHVTGGLGIVTVVACMFFAAISGSGVATAAAMGAIMIPEMQRNGYDKNFAGIITASASPIGIVIPPSISFILYGVITGSSIADLYMAGIPAGVMMGLGLIVVTYFVSKKRGYKRSDVKYSASDKFIAFKESLWALGTPIILVGGVFGGVFTPTESAVVAVVYAIIVGVFIYKEMKIKDLYSIFVTSSVTTIKIMFIIANATLFAYVLAYEQIPQLIVEGMLNLSSNPFILMLLINVFLLLAGTFMESSAIIIILVPLLWPVAQLIGIDVVHFGIIVTVNTAIGLLTPPFGVCLFTTASVGNIKVEELYKDSLMFLGILVLVLLVITYIPQTIMFLQP